MIKGIAILFAIISTFPQAFAQDSEDYISLRGTVKSLKTNLPIPFANISLKNQPIGINANEEGKFELNIEPEYQFDTISFSAIGYVTQEFLIYSYLAANDKVIMLVDTAYQLDNIFITSIPAKEIVSRAIRNIPQNYPARPYMLKGFYRTSFRENNQYVRLLESALEVYDEGFETKNGISTRHQKMRKSFDYRKYKWTESANYLTSFIMGDFIRNPEGNLQDLFGKWNYNVRGVTFLDKEEVFLIDANIPIDNPYESYNAQLFVRIKDYAILQLNYDYKWDPNYFPGIDVDSVTLKRTNVSIMTFYRQYRGKLYLSYQSREAQWNIYDHSKTGALVSKMEIHDELLIHKVDPRHGKQPDEKLNEYGDIYKEVSRYDKRFWKRYNKPVETNLFRSIKRDLEKETPLERQFRAEKMEDVMK
ncbi:MAG: carboxypeptidase-like regulatory domain-containing protein [Cyclobacteriaceae bacterium]|nr:carboxypeptidase-like regulatory domain-containing protein [Cyclobacteriaceae bacterium]